jgi:hypothetical protein
MKLKKNDFLTLRDEKGKQVALLKVVSVDEVLDPEEEQTTTEASVQETSVEIPVTPEKTEEEELDEAFKDIKEHELAGDASQSNTDTFDKQDFVDFQFWSKRIGIWDEDKTKRAVLHSPYVKQFFNNENATVDNINPENIRKYNNYLKQCADNMQKA